MIMAPAEASPARTERSDGICICIGVERVGSGVGITALVCALNGADFGIVIVMGIGITRERTAIDRNDEDDGADLADTEAASDTTSSSR